MNPNQISQTKINHQNLLSMSYGASKRFQRLQCLCSFSSLFDTVTLLNLNNKFCIYVFNWFWIKRTIMKRNRLTSIIFSTLPMATLISERISWIHIVWIWIAFNIIWHWWCDWGSFHRIFVGSVWKNVKLDIQSLPVLVFCIYDISGFFGSRRSHFRY